MNREIALRQVSKMERNTSQVAEDVAMPRLPFLERETTPQYNVFLFTLSCVVYSTQNTRGVNGESNHIPSL